MGHNIETHRHGTECNAHSKQAMWTLSDLLGKSEIDPEGVLVIRHSPPEKTLARVLPWFVADRPEVFNAYQQTQKNKRVEEALSRAERLASFIGLEPKHAVFAGLYNVASSRPITREQYANIPAKQQLKKHGSAGFDDSWGRNTCLFFELEPTDWLAQWKGKLTIAWPGSDRAWWRWAANNDFSIRAILRESDFNKPMPAWSELILSWNELQDLPRTWEEQLRQWTGIYHIGDTSDSKSYVGAAYGKDRMLDRWRGYARSGHGGNALLRTRDPNNFVFSILQRLSPDALPEEVVKFESNWKMRLNTRQPFGLNEN